MIKGNCILTAKVIPDHYMILLCCQSLQEHIEHHEAAFSCFANTENLNEQVLSRNDKFTYKNTLGDKTHANAI